MSVTRPGQRSDATGPLVAPGPPSGAGGGSSRPGGQSTWLRALIGGARRRWWWALVAAVVAAGSLVAVDASSPAGSYGLTAVFAKAPGLFPGATVDVLGVPVGTVSSVDNVGDAVRVGLDITGGRPIPAKAVASLVEPELLGEPNIELDPGYTGGPALASGAVIPEQRTAVPVSTEQLLKSLQRTLDAVNPHAVGGLIANLAQDLQGQGPGLNKLISGAAGTLTLLSQKADSLGQLSGALAQLTGTLDSRTSEITQLVTDYDTVSSIVAQHGSQLGDAVTQLSQASTQIVQLLTPNLGPLEQDVGTITTVGRTLDRNLGNVDQIFGSATSLFSAAKRAYTPVHNWLTLNLQLPAGVTGAYVAGLVRDRLAGVCRRIAAHHAAGLTAAQLATLQQCGNPASGYFNPIIDQIPAILNALASGTAPPSAASPSTMLQQGLAQIPGVPHATSSAPSTTAPSSPSGSGAGAGPSPSTSTTTTAPPSSGSGGSPCLGGVLGSSVTCSSGSTGSGSSGSGSSGSSGSGSSGSSGSGSSGSSGSGSSGSSSSGGLGGLLSYRQPVGALRTSGTGVLPPLPAGAPGAGGHHPARTAGHRSSHAGHHAPAAAGRHPSRSGHAGHHAPAAAGRHPSRSGHAGHHRATGSAR